MTLKSYAVSPSILHHLRLYGRGVISTPASQTAVAELVEAYTDMRTVLREFASDVEDVSSGGDGVSAASGILRTAREILSTLTVSNVIYHHGDKSD